MSIHSEFKFSRCFAALGVMGSPFQIPKAIPEECFPQLRCFPKVLTSAAGAMRACRGSVCSCSQLYCYNSCDKLPPFGRNLTGILFLGLAHPAEAGAFPRSRIFVEVADMFFSGCEHRQVPRVRNPDGAARRLRLPLPSTGSSPAASCDLSSSTLRASLLCLAVIAIVLACASCHKQEPPPRPYVAFVVNHLGNSVAVVDLADPKVIATIPVAPLPEKAVRRPGRNEVYVVSQSGKISVIKFPALTVARTIDIGPSAEDLVFSPDGNHAYVLDPSAGQVVFLDCGTLKETGRARLVPNLSHLAITPDGKTLIASDPAGNRLFFVAAETQKVLGDVAVGKTPGDLAVSLDSSVVFVADTGDEKISAAQIASRTIIAHIETGSRPGALVLKPDGGELFVLSDGSSTVTIVDASHDNVEQILPTGRDPVAAVFKQDSSVMYVATQGDGFVTAFDIANRAVLNTVHVGVAPQALALTPDERFLAVADSASGALAIVRAASLSLITVVPVGANPIDVLIPGWEWKQ